MRNEQWIHARSSYEISPNTEKLSCKKRLITHAGMQIEFETSYGND